MALAPLLLDDLDWARLTEASRLRLPALSAGQWTLHSPIDPGITLVELYAWLLDQRIYWMDQVPEPLFRAAIALLGEQMQPVGTARTVLTLDRDAGQNAVAPGTTIEIARAEEGPVFATVDGITLLRVARISLSVRRTDGTDVDRTNDLNEHRGVPLFRSDRQPGEARVTLYLRSAPPGSSATRPISLFLDIDAAPKVQPEWDPSATAVAPPAVISWWYSRGAGLPPQRLTDDAVRDGTGGLRRAGVVRLAVPADWQADGPAVGGVTPYSLFARTAEAAFTFPPVARRIVANAAIAEHERLVRVARRETGWLPLPGLAIELDRDAAPPIPDRVRLHLREVGGRWRRWRPVPDFAQAGPADRVFRVNREPRRIEFGDGLNGRIPKLESLSAGPNIRIAVVAGAGAGGNVGAGLGWTGTVAADVRGRSEVAAAGGVEAETMETARLRIAGSLQRVERAVTPNDHVTLAESTPGISIARAHAAVGFHPGYPCSIVPGSVTVFVVPWAPRGSDVDDALRVAAPMPDPGALAAVRALFERTRMVGTEVWICPPRYRVVRLKVRMSGEPVEPAATRQRIGLALRRFLDPLEGGDDGDGWPFGDPLRPSALMREVARSTEDAIVQSVAIGLDGDAPSEDCVDVPIGPHDLVTAADIAITFGSDGQPLAGGLR